MKSCTLLCFDLDGTLVDSASEIAEAANRTLEDFGLARRPPADITRLIGAGTRELMLRLLAEVLLESPPRAQRLPVDDVLARMESHYGRLTGSSAVPYPGAREALKRLAAAGIRLACVTNKEQRHADQLLRAMRLAQHFELLIGGDTLPHKKPHRSVLEHVMRMLGGHPASTAHVGDSAVDVEAARAAGVESWAVPYGYNSGRPIAEAGPTRIFADLTEVAEHALALHRGAPADSPRDRGALPSAARGLS